MSIVDQAEQGDIVMTFGDLDFFIEADAEDMVADLVVAFEGERFHFREARQPKKCC